jgi:DNA modification methylase
VSRRRAAAAPEWPADKVRRRPIGELAPSARNARTHSDEQVRQIAASIEEWGWTIPVLVDEAGEVIAGHGRILAAQHLGIAEVPCMVAEGWTDAQKRAYRLADNKLALNAGWDEPQLRIELDDLMRGSAFDVGLIGFSGAELDEILLGGDEVEAGLSDPDEVPEPPAGDTAVTCRGDLWVLGEHRLVCGDATSPADVARVVGGEAADAAWTDPPYNVAYESKAGRIANDDLSAEAFGSFLGAAFAALAEHVRPGGAVYVAHADTEGEAFRRAFREAGLKLSGCLVWVKNALVLGRSDYQWRHEPILYGWRPGAAHQWFGGRARTTVVEASDMPWSLDATGAVQIDLGEVTLRISGADLEVEELVGTVRRAEKPRRSAEHPTMKPVGLIVPMLQNSTRRGESVLDPFGGSGSTLIACHQTGRRARLVEWEPRYADVIVRRWEEFSGREARLESGETFAEVRARRRPADDG